MIPRYENKEISRIWSRQHQLFLWVRWECILPAVYHGNLSTRINEAVDRLDYDRLDREMMELELTNGHDVASFVQALQNQLTDLGFPEKLVNVIHRYPITSSDIVDNAMMDQIRESLAVVKHLSDRLLTALTSLTLLPGTTCSRTHGQAAIPMESSARWKQHHSEIERSTHWLHQLVRQLPGKVGGIDGTATTDLELFESLSEDPPLGAFGDGFKLIRCTQIIPRDCHARIANELALMASVVGRFALTVRLLSQTGINEVAEPKPSAYKGSSAMPHKHNPTVSENASGMARLARSYASAINESVELWLERDISHSCVERVVWPDLFHVVCNQLERMTHVANGLTVNSIQSLGSPVDLNYNSAKRLDELIAGGMDREQAYRQIQDEQPPSY